MLIGAHAIIYSTDAEADRTFLRDSLGLPHVDVGGGWLIFGLPPAEVAVHPADKAAHELYFMCADITAFRKAVTERGVACSEVRDEDWGLVTEVTLPGGGRLGVYQPRHARPPAMAAGAKRRLSVRSAAKPRAKKRPVKTSRTKGARGRASRKR